MSVLGLIAGSGPLPFEVARAAAEHGLGVAIAAIERSADSGLEALARGPFDWFAPGELGRIINFFKAAGCDQVILAGAVSRRELMKDPAALKPDTRALALLSRLVDKGDDALLRAVAGEIESAGLAVVDSTLYLGERLTAPGLIAGGPLEARVEADLALGLRVARGVGAYDVGQCVVVKDGAVLAVEALEGTDAALERGAALSEPGAVLVKVAKPGQDLRFDVPAIGPETAARAVECGLAAIGLEAGRTLVLEREATVRALERGGVALVGLQPEGAKA